MAAALSREPASHDSGADLEMAIAALRANWQGNARWPIVIDDPEITEDFGNVLASLLEANPASRAIVATRSRSESEAGEVFVTPLTHAEVARVIHQLPETVRSAVEKFTVGKEAVSPLDLRKSAASQLTPSASFFDEEAQRPVDSKTKEIVAFIAVSPEPLTLEALGELSTAGAEGPVALIDRLESVSYLIVDDGLGYRVVHDEITRELRASLASRRGLHRFVSLRLAQYFARKQRFAAAFELYKEIDPNRALRAAYRAATQAAIEGRFNFSITPLEYIIDVRRSRGERLDLAVTLMALAQAYGNVW
jgi:hypothetical protein